MNIYHITGMWYRCLGVHARIQGVGGGDRTQALDFLRNTSHLRTEAGLILPGESCCGDMGDGPHPLPT